MGSVERLQQIARELRRIERRDLGREAVMPVERLHLTP
ncbi:MAG: hypothetical protein RL033_2114, partial [Pseudomonadota bacterium]